VLNSAAPPQSLYALDTAKGAHQQVGDLIKVFDNPASVRVSIAALTMQSSLSVHVMLLDLVLVLPNKGQAPSLQSQHWEAHRRRFIPIQRLQLRRCV
jgi:hypothetical protein